MLIKPIEDALFGEGGKGEVESLFGQPGYRYFRFDGSPIVESVCSPDAARFSWQPVGNSPA